MKIQAGFVCSILIIIGLTACNIPVDLQSFAPSAEARVKYQTISALLTQTAQPEAGDAATPVFISQDVTFTATNQPTLVIEATQEVTATPTPVIIQPDAETPPCDLAMPGRPFDISVPDETRFYPDEYFSKTWRLVNAGSCTWDESYNIVWFSGEDMGVSPSLSLQTRVLPGDSVEVTVDMIAPENPGSYQSNWKLRNNQGQLFGIGPDGNSPFWVRIIVIPDESITPTPTPPEATPTIEAIIYSGGILENGFKGGFDLDNGQVNQDEKDDVGFGLPPEGGVQLIPLNGLKMAIYGQDTPGYTECIGLEMTDISLPLDTLAEGTYICYRTANGLPGRLLVLSADPESEQGSLEFVTWVAP